MRIAKRFGALALLLCVGLAGPWGSARAADEGKDAMDRVGLQPTGPGTFSIDVSDADIRTIARAISEFSGRNIIVAKDVKATVSAKLTNVGWREALRTMLYSANLDYDEDGSILRVDERTKMLTERADRLAAIAKQMENAPLETRIIKLNYASASELQSSLQAGLTRRGSILVEKRTNSLIVSDLTNNLDSVEKMAIALDSTTPQIEITAKLVDVDVEALRDLGVTWNVGGSTSDGIVNPNLIPGPPAPGRLPINPGDDAQQILQGNQTTTIPAPAATITYGLFKDWGSFEAQLQVLEQNRKANIISNPRITTVDNREAKIIVGQKIPLIVQDVAGNPVSQLQTIGIQLKVTPHLTQDKKIIMDLHPEVSDLSTQSTVQGGIIINTSEADTRVMVDDGQTAVIGGLIRTNDSSVRRGVPILKDVPLIGMLFRSSNNVSQNRELIIFVTPRIISTMANN
jgi:type IV pilus assembly protein PilQ